MLLFDFGPALPLMVKLIIVTTYFKSLLELTLNESMG